MMERQLLGSSIKIRQLQTMLILQRGGHGACNWTMRGTPDSPGGVAAKTVEYVVRATTTVTKVWSVTCAALRTGHVSRAAPPPICRTVLRVGSQCSQSFCV